AFGFAATSPVNTTALVNGWFEKRRGLALSMATSGSAYGQLLIVPVATVILMNWGWRASYLAITIALLLLILPIAIFFIRDAPRDRPARGRGGQIDDRPKVSLGRAVRTAAYWQLSFGMFVCGFTMSFTSVHMIPYLTDMPEHSAHTMQTTASLALSVVGACSILGAIVMGFLSDRAGHRHLLAVGSWIPGIFLAAIVLGISWTSTTPLASAMAADIYGRASLATIFGFIFTAMNVGSGVGAWLAGLDYDITGNYHASLLANVGMGVAAAVVTFVIRERPVAPVPAGVPGLAPSTATGD
ncbi:MAG TPA: MFS transporter, partial [Thermomicrobiales bacterium]|nr:MFS transporter [Thermomicrobiales bacterium]